MNNTQLDTFLKLVDTRNFTTTANMLGYAQSTVTTQIKQLEEELGCLLFERLGKTLALTPEGEKLIAYAEQMLKIQREILLEVSGKNALSGVIKLGVSESLCYNRLPISLTKYKKKYPKMDIQLQFIEHETFPALLKNGTLDLVYTLNPLMESPELKMLHKKREALAFFASPEHPLSRKKKIKENDLENIPLLLTSHNCSFRHMLLQDFIDHQVTPKIELETSSKEVLKQFAINGLGIAFMPTMVAENEIKGGVLRELNWTGADFPVYSQVFIHKDKHMSRAMEELIDLIVE